MPLTDVSQSSRHLAISKVGTLHLRRIVADRNGPAVLMVHGAVENGRIFYSASGRGLAPFLARHGFDCWVLDLRGRGDSRPHVDRDATWGQNEELVEDLPRAIEEITETRGHPPGPRQSRWAGELGEAGGLVLRWAGVGV